MLPNTNNNFTVVSFVSISEVIIEPSIMLSILTAKHIKKETKGIGGMLDLLKH